MHCRAKFNALNHVELTDAEFKRLMGDIIQADVFKASRLLREPGYMERAAQRAHKRGMLQQLFQTPDEVDG